MRERWKRIIIDGYSTNYEISNEGRARHITSKNHVGVYANKATGYLFCCIYSPESKKLHTVPVAKLVAEAFLGPRPKGKQIAHLDETKTNNNARNLAYLTQSENIRLSYAHGGRRRHSGGPRFSPQAYKLIRRLHRGGMSLNQIAKRLGISIASASRIVRGLTKPRGNRELTLEE